MRDDHIARTFRLIAPNRRATRDERGELHAAIRAAEQAEREAEVARAEIAQELRDLRAGLEQAQTAREEASRQLEALRDESRAALDRVNAARERAQRERDTVREDANRLREDVASLKARLEATQPLSGINQQLSILIERLPQEKPAKGKGAK